MSKEITQKATQQPIVLSLPEFGESMSFTGEVVKVPRLEVPSIRVNYKDPEEGQVSRKGEFVEYDPATKETKFIGKKLLIQILHHRQSLSAFKDLDDGKSESLYTPEVSMKTKDAPLFMATAGADGKRSSQFLMEGPIKKDEPASLRGAYPTLRYQRSLYILHEGKLKNLVVYGASFSGFIDFTKAIQGQSSAGYVVELTTGKGKKGVVTYYPIIFTQKEATDMKVIGPVGMQLAKWFEEYDKRIAEQREVRQEQSANDRGDESDKPAAVKTPGAETKVNHADRTDEEQAEFEAEADKILSGK